MADLLRREKFRQRWDVHLPALAQLRAQRREEPAQQGRGEVLFPDRRILAKEGIVQRQKPQHAFFGERRAKVCVADRPLARLGGRRGIQVPPLLLALFLVAGAFSRALDLELHRVGRDACGLGRAHGVNFALNRVRHCGEQSCCRFGKADTSLVAFEVEL